MTAPRKLEHFRTAAPIRDEYGSSRADQVEPVLGLIIGAVVPAASAHDNATGKDLLDQTAERCGNRLEKALVDQGFKDDR